MFFRKSYRPFGLQTLVIDVPSLDIIPTYGKVVDLKKFEHVKGEVSWNMSREYQKGHYICVEYVSGDIKLVEPKMVAEINSPDIVLEHLEEMRAHNIAQRESLEHTINFIRKNKIIHEMVTRKV